MLTEPHTNGDRDNVALAIPDPRRAPIPQGWAAETFAPLVLHLDWDELDDAEARIRGLASEIESLEGDRTELLKAWRMVEARRGEVLDPDARPGRPSGNVPRVDNYPDVAPATASRYREMARHWPIVWPKIATETDPRKLSQAAVLRLIDEHKRNEVGPERKPSTNGAKSESTWTEDPEADAPDLVQALEDSQSRILALQAERDSLQKTDKDAEIARLHETVARLEGLRTADQNRALQQEKIIKSQRRVLEQAAGLLGVSSFGEIVPAIQDLLR